MFVIHLWHFDSETFVPAVRVGDRIDNPGCSEANTQEEEGQGGHGECEVVV